MDLEVADRLITQFLHTHWTTTPIAWPNLEARQFGSPSQPLLPDGTADFLSVRSFLVTNQPITVQTGCVRSFCQLHLDVCVKSGTGVRAAKRHLAGLVARCEGATLVDDPAAAVVRMKFATGGASYVADNGWWVEGVVIPFEFERYATLTIYPMA